MVQSAGESLIKHNEKAIEKFTSISEILNALNMLKNNRIILTSGQKDLFRTVYCSLGTYFLFMTCYIVFIYISNSLSASLPCKAVPIINLPGEVLLSFMFIY